MILYHGSDCNIETVDLSLCRPFKDFGRGFYLTTIKKQAQRMAERVARINDSKPILNSFDFDLDLSNTDYCVKTFEKPTVEWARFVLDNRNTTGFSHNYDIVIGPVANDGIALLFRQFMEGLISIDSIVTEMTYKEENIQYCFCTERAIKSLKKI